MQVFHKDGKVVIRDVMVVVAKEDGNSERVGKGEVRLTEFEAWSLSVGDHKYLLAQYVDEARRFNRMTKQQRISDLEAELKQLKETL